MSWSWKAREKIAGEGESLPPPSFQILLVPWPSPPAFLKGKARWSAAYDSARIASFFFFLINYKLLSFDKLSIFENSFRIKILSFNDIPIIYIYIYYSFHSLYSKLITFRSDRRNSTKDSFSLFFSPCERFTFRKERAKPGINSSSTSKISSKRRRCGF